VPAHVPVLGVLGRTADVGDGGARRLSVDSDLSSAWGGQMDGPMGEGISLPFHTTPDRDRAASVCVGPALWAVLLGFLCDAYTLLGHLVCAGY